MLLVAAFALDGPLNGQESAVQRSFSGDSVRMALSGGNYRVVRSPDDRIRVMPLATGGGQPNDISASLDLSLTGRRADLTVRSPREATDVRIEVPQRVNLDIDGRNGNVEIVIGDRDQYKRVTASIRNGTLTAPAFDENAKGSGSFAWKGAGERELRIRLDSGRLTLR
jgi:hypothetical protein